MSCQKTCTRSSLFVSTGTRGSTGRWLSRMFILISFHLEHFIYWFVLVMGERPMPMQAPRFYCQFMEIDGHCLPSTSNVTCGKMNAEIDVRYLLLKGDRPLCTRIEPLCSSFILNLLFMFLHDSALRIFWQLAGIHVRFHRLICKFYSFFK